MNRIAALLILILFNSCDQSKQADQSQNAEQGQSPDTTLVSVPAQVEPPPSAPSDPIALIRKQVERINTIELEKKHFEFMCDEKMMVDYFYSDGEIVKIAVDFATIGDVYAREAYYYNAGKLIFNYEFVEGGPACEGCIKTDEYRSYVKDNSVIKYLKNKTESKCRTCEFPASSRQLRLLTATTAKEMKKILCGF